MRPDDNKSTSGLQNFFQKILVVSTKNIIPLIKVFFPKVYYSKL